MRVEIAMDLNYFYDPHKSTKYLSLVMDLLDL